MNEQNMKKLSYEEWREQLAPLWAQSVEYSYLYAKSIIDGRFELSEKTK